MKALAALFVVLAIGCTAPAIASDTGKVVGWIDLTGLASPAAATPDPVNDVLNGIAYDARHNRLFVTGKRWPHVYEIRLTGPRSNIQRKQ
jgi:glutaminyl-peptide cyclotransferase